MIRRSLWKLASLWVGMGVFFALATNGLWAMAQAETKHQSWEAIDAYLAGQMRDLEIPGLAVGIVRGDQVVYVKGYGVADDAGRAVTPQTPFLIASLSKSFTALGIMQLVEEGKIDLEAPVQRYLPWFRTADEALSAKITVRHLLHQTSGFAERESYIRNLNRNRAEDALETSVRELRREPLKHPPGTTFEYANTNYDILGLIIQTVSGRSYQDFMRDRIFAPLEMKHSYASLASARDGGMVSGYYSFFGHAISYDRFMPYSPVTTPSAGLFASAEDMAHYLIAHLNQGAYWGTSILSPAGIAELHTPGVKIGETVSYAMGWVVFPFPDAVTRKGDPVPTALSHRGEWVGFQVTMVLIPAQDLGVVVLVNKSDPAQGAAFANLGWNMSLLALGLEPVSFPTANFITQHGRWLLAGILLLLVISCLWAARRIARFPVREGLDQRERRRLAWQTMLMALIDALLAGWLLFIHLPQNKDTLALALSFSPDFGLMYILLLILTLGWGTLRTLLFLAHLRKSPTVAGATS